MDNLSIWLLLPIFAVGVVLLVKGGDIFVDAASVIAKVFGIPQFIIGATIVSIATTMPELLVSVFAAAEGSVEMAIGNAVGSVTANTGLIMAIAMLFMSIRIDRKDYWVQIFGLLGATLLLVFASIGYSPLTWFTSLFQSSETLAINADGHLAWWGSAALFVIFVVFMWKNVSLARNGSSEKVERIQLTKKELIWTVAKFLIGAVMIVVGSQVLVKSGSAIAVKLGVPERVIAVTMVAIGTSLPELVTTITAISKKQSGLSIGNLIGANLIDMSMILPICSIVSGQQLPVPASSLLIDMPVCFIVLCIGLIPLFCMKKSSKVFGALLLMAYIAYIVMFVL